MTERDIFLALLDIPKAADRSAFLEKACGGDAAWRAGVESLLSAHDTAGGFLGKAARPPAHQDEEATQAVDVGPVADHWEDVESNDFSLLAASTRAASLGRLGHYEIL